MAFILRTIKEEKNCNPLNRIIGNSYTLSTIFGKGTKEWLKDIREYYPEIKLEDAQEIVAMVIGSECLLIFKGWFAYIMTDEGNTFEKIPTK